MSGERTGRRSRIRSRVRAARLRLRSRGRALPDVLILGAQKCGTTSLFTYLMRGPGFLGPAKKELHHFDAVGDERRDEFGITWYRAQFPRRRSLAAAGAITGEASPTYMLEPSAMDRIADDLPDSKWIVVLRDPVERAFSQYSARVGHDLESEPFDVVIDRELSRLRRLGPMRRQRGSGPCFVERGHFADQLAHLAGLRPDRPTLVLFSENLFEQHVDSFELLHTFLDLPLPRPAEFPHANTSPKVGAMDTATREVLTAHFAIVNADLTELLSSAQFLTVDRQDWPDWIRPAR